MIKKIFNLFILLAPVFLVSCYDDEHYEASTIGDDTAAVQLRVTARNLNDLNATRAAGDYYEYEVDGEYMNTLCVFVTDASTGVIEVKFGPDLLDAYPFAQGGNLPTWTSNKIILTTGRKRVYAFSNWNNMNSEEWEALIAKKEGETIGGTDLHFVVDDPVSKVDIAHGQYIPMSGHAETTVLNHGADLNSSVQYIDVAMDRLVGQVWVDVQELYSSEDNLDPNQATLYNFTFSGWADGVPMMSNDDTDYSEKISYTKVTALSLNDFVISAHDDPQEVNIAKFYVNETTRPTDEGGFGVALHTDMYGGTSYIAQTTQTEIARNYIYPIVLTLDTYRLILDVQAWATVIGAGEREYQTTIDGYYTFTLLDVTSKFAITPAVMKGNDRVATNGWRWTYNNTDDGEVTVDDQGGITITNVTATPGYKYNFTLSATWTDSGGRHERNYDIIAITFDEGTGRTPWLAITRHCATPAQPEAEYINMMTPKPTKIVRRKI